MVALGELLKRLWPAPKPVELAAGSIRVELEEERPRYHTLSAEPEALAQVLGILAPYVSNGHAPAEENG